MKLHLDAGGGLNQFTGYGDDYVAINGERHAASVIVLPRGAVKSWSPARFADLHADDFNGLAEAAPEIVLLGTGAKLRFPRPEVTRPLIDARIGVEVMDVQAACRTFNILVAEGRQVAAALLVGTAA